MLNSPCFPIVAFYTSAYFQKKICRSNFSTFFYIYFQIFLKSSETYFHLVTIKIRAIIFFLLQNWKKLCSSSPINPPVHGRFTPHTHSRACMLLDWVHKQTNQDFNSVTWPLDLSWHHLVSCSSDTHSRIEWNGGF